MGIVLEGNILKEDLSMSITLVFSAAQKSLCERFGSKFIQGSALTNEGQVVDYTSACRSDKCLAELSANFGDVSVVAEVEKIRQVADQNGEPLNRSEWAEWGYDPNAPAPGSK